VENQEGSEDMTEIHTIQNVTGPTVTIAVPPEFAGQQVAIEVRVVPKKTEPWGEGLKRCAGALADEPEWDAVMEEVHQARKLERRPLPEDE
jgi:FKBP-type peptidyl-prolyl cis-trans isomerase 2